MLDLATEVKFVKGVGPRVAEWLGQKNIWTVEDLLSEIRARDPRLAQRVYLLEDCTSPVVVSGVVDFSDQADAAFRRFAQTGMHVVSSTTPLESWPGIRL